MEGRIHTAELGSESEPWAPKSREWKIPLPAFVWTVTERKEQYKQAYLTAQVRELHHHDQPRVLHLIKNESNKQGKVTAKRHEICRPSLPRHASTLLPSFTLYATSPPSGPAAHAPL